MVRLRRAADARSSRTDATAGVAAVRSGETVARTADWTTSAMPGGCGDATDDDAGAAAVSSTQRIIFVKMMKKGSA